MAKHRRTQEILPPGGLRDADKELNSREAISLRLCRGLILSLFLFRFFYVAESADKGDTLGVVGAWIVALVLWAILSWKFAIPIAQFRWFDLGVGLLVAGHVVSALLIIVTEGDKRSAINLGWEWIGVGIGWFLMRQQCREAPFRNELLAGILATGTSVACLGLYQHYIEFPQMEAKFGPMFDRLRNAGPAEAASLRQAMAKENIPTEDPGLTLFEKRLRDSREPLGFFALANTLGGFLAVCLILSVAAAVSFRNGPDAARSWLVIWIGMILIMGWCLLLTKSRTAWIGSAIGLVALVSRMQEAKLTAFRLWIAAGSLVLLFLAGWGLSRLGGLDRQVFTEAPKSLQYRFQYWAATSRMIADHLVFGVGPGQFRWHYLFYKLPEASEEISDPHNLFLDAAANGGLAAVVGLVLLCVLVLAPLNRTATATNGNSFLFPPEISKRNVVLFGFASVTGVWLLFTGSDDRLLFLLPFSVVLYWLFISVMSVSGYEWCSGSMGSRAAAIGLLVHLCGAGGIGMPAVSMLLLALIASMMESKKSLPPDGIRPSTNRAVWLAGTGIGLIIAWYATGFHPVSQVQQKLDEGDRLVRRMLIDAADAQYRSAAAADLWASEPWRRRAELAYRKFNTDQYRSNDSFQNAVNLMNEAKLRDPGGFRDDRRLGEWWFARWLKTANIDDAKKAVTAFKQAWNRYPTNAALMAEMAMAMVASKSDAHEVARKAMEQDAINRDRGHIDRFLDEATRRKLEELLDGPIEQRPSHH